MDSNRQQSQTRTTKKIIINWKNNLTDPMNSREIDEFYTDYLLLWDELNDN